MLVMGGSLIMACLFSIERRISIAIVNYFVFVQLYGVLRHIFTAALLFVDNYYYHLSVFGALDVLLVGRLYKERIVAEQLVLDVDYAYRVNSYLFGVVKVQKILNRDDAIKAKWITEGGGRDRGHGIEMMGTDGGSDGGTNPSTAENAVDSAVFQLDGIYIRDSDVAVGDCNNRINNGTNIDLVITENPIHALAATSLSRTNKHIHDDNYDHGDNDASAEDDDDAALYLEYQNMQSSTSGDTVYDMNAADDIEVAMSFDEWKTRRKQFKQGTYLHVQLLIYLFSNYILVIS